MPDITLNDPSVPDGPALAAALEAKRELLSRMPASAVLQMARLDPRAAASVVAGSLPRIAKHRGELVAQFGGPAGAAVDDLPTVVYALYQAQYDVVASEDDSDLREHARDLGQEHQILIGDLDALANRRIIDRARIDPGRPVQGYQTLVDSTFVLLSVCRSLWPTIEGKTMLTTADLDRIEAKAQSMLQRLDQRQQGSTQLPVREMRARALTLLVRSYDEIRRMLAFVRWSQGDADDIAPSLYARRGRGRRGGTDTDATDDEDLEPAIPTPAPAPTPIVIDAPNNGGTGPFQS